MTESPRPYTELLAAEQLIETPETFYQLDRKQQANVINQISEHVSDWRTRHWQGEKDYLSRRAIRFSFRFVWLWWVVLTEQVLYLCTVIVDGNERRI